MALTLKRLPPSRSNRLQLCISISGWWLMGQGALFCLTGDWLSEHAHLRYSVGMEPYVRLCGMALLCLGLFTNRAVRQANRQYLAVDTLVLYFLGCTIFSLSNRIQGNSWQWFEIVSLLVNLGLGSALIVYRTRGSEMRDGSLVAMDILDALRPAASKVGLKLPETSSPTAEAPLPDFPEPGEEAPRKKSEAMPHMD